MTSLGQHDNQDEDSTHAILIGDVYETKQTRENEKPPCSKDETRRNQTKAKPKPKMKPKEKAEDKDEVDDRDKKKKPNACLPHANLQIRSDGKADKEAKYRECEHQGNEEETLPQKAH